MARVAAERRIATVENAKAQRLFVVAELVCQPVRGNEPSPPAANSHVAVASAIHLAAPEPAVGSAEHRNLCPQAFCDSRREAHFLCILLLPRRRKKFANGKIPASGMHNPTVMRNASVVTSTTSGDPPIEGVPQHRKVEEMAAASGTPSHCSERPAFAA